MKKSKVLEKNFRNLIDIDKYYDIRIFIYLSSKFWLEIVLQSFY